MGCEIVVSGGTTAERHAVEALFAERDRRFSRFRADSELNAVNAAGETALVSEEFAAALAVALDAAAATDGMVDPTLGAALVAMGYDRDFASLADADQTECGPAAPGCWKSIRLTGKLLSRPPAVQLDLNGVVKALAVDDALGLVSGPGFVAAGGDLAARGAVDVALPRGGATRLILGAIATSGRIGRSWLCGGAEQHHLIDPRTGRASRSPWTQVTAVGATCVAADVCAKAAFLLGDTGPAWLDAHGVPGRFLAQDRVVVNDHWATSLERAPACI
jgi:FAD:protein FMN transferase